jgi:hypothetical protein
MKAMEIVEHNRIAWDAQAEQGNRWTVPVAREAIEAARHYRQCPGEAQFLWYKPLNG